MLEYLWITELNAGSAASLENLDRGCYGSGPFFILIVVGLGGEESWKRDEAGQSMESG